MLAIVVDIACNYHCSLLHYGCSMLCCIVSYQWPYVHMCIPVCVPFVFRLYSVVFRLCSACILFVFRLHSVCTACIPFVFPFVFRLYSR